MSKCMMMAAAVVTVACAPTSARDEVGSTGSKEAVARLGKSFQLGSTALTPVAVEEDSRCPADVQCIQAGTVRVRVRVVEGPESMLSSVALREPLRLATGWLHLTAVCPPRLASANLSVADYLLTFELAPGAVPSQPESRC